MRNLARQSLLPCRQKLGEFGDTFTERLIFAVKAAIVGLSGQTAKEIMLDHFLGKSLPHIAFHIMTRN